MDKNTALILCGMFARSNMGLGDPDAYTMAQAKKRPPHTPRESAEMFCAQFMESDSHEDMFAGEAEMWFNTLMDEKEEEFRKTFADKFKLLDEAE